MQHTAQFEKKHKKAYAPQPNKKTAKKLLPGQCMLCGRHFDLLTQVHAEQDGYKDVEALIASGYIRFERDRNAHRQAATR